MLFGQTRWEGRHSIPSKAGYVAGSHNGVSVRHDFVGVGKRHGDGTLFVCLSTTFHGKRSVIDPEFGSIDRLPAEFRARLSVLPKPQDGDEIIERTIRYSITTADFRNHYALIARGTSGEPRTPKELASLKITKSRMDWMSARPMLARIDRNCPSLLRPLADGIKSYFWPSNSRI